MLETSIQAKNQSSAPYFIRSSKLVRYDTTMHLQSSQDINHSSTLTSKVVSQSKGKMYESMLFWKMYATVWVASLFCSYR